MNNNSEDNYLKKELYELIKSDESIFDFFQFNLFDGLWYWDLDHPENEWMNTKFWRVLGYNPDEMPHKSSAWQNIINQDDLKVATVNFIKHCEDPTHPYEQDVRYTHKNGSIVWIKCFGKAIRNSEGKAIRMLGAHIDFTAYKYSEELKLALEKSEKSENKFRLIAENIGEVFWLRNADNSKMLYVSPAYEKVWGRSCESLYQKPQSFIDAIIDDDKPIVFAEFDKYKETGIFDMQYRIKNTCDEIRWVHAKSFTVKNNIGEIINHTGIAVDITERKKIEQKLIVAKEHAEKSEKNLQIKNEEYEALNEELKQTNDDLLLSKVKAEESDRLKTAFLQNLSHEIRTPLNAICGFSGMLNKPELSEEKRKSFTSIIQTSSNQLLSIVSDILTISSLETKQEKINIEKVCINNIIVDLLSIFKQQTKNQNISIYSRQSFSDEHSVIYTDKTKITQILSNLISNALKFTHEGFVEFGYNLKNNELEFYVKDSGIGIIPELHEKIFERFGQADRSINIKYGGTGLGLAISKGFAELLGGKIWVNSEIDKGSTFYFTIPYKPVNEIDISKTNNLANSTNNKPTILVAEDEEFNFLYIEELLIDFDYKLIHAKDGQETVDIFKTNPDISLILMDIKMPIMDGHTAAKIIKEQKSDIRIVAQSAYALEHEKAKYEGIFDDYLTKPINENDLKQKVMKYIEI